jgi:mannonate dehydratase
MPRASRRPSRRALLALGGGGVAGLLALRLGAPWYLRPGPVRPVSALSDAAQALVHAALAGLDPARVVDVHVHVAGFGADGSGCWVNPRLASHLAPIERLRFELYLAGAGVREDERADAEYVARLRELQAGGIPGRLLLYAFDVRVDAHGNEDLEHSMFRVPDAHVLRLAREHGGAGGFLACASVHPYRADALARLERARDGGAVAVKWLPSAMGIDPADPICAAYYATLVELGLPLLVHTGEERAVWAEDAQELGNPLLLRRALEAGVTVVALHCASLGSARDLDRADGAPADAFGLFLRLLAEHGAHGTGGRLFGELGALTQINRDPDVLRTLLARTDLHPRLVNGSDYPLVAIDPLTSLGRLARAGLLDPDERPALREVFAANPLLFDLVLKRRLRVTDTATARRFGPEVFESARLFDKL